MRRGAWTTIVATTVLSAMNAQAAAPAYCPSSAPAYVRQAPTCEPLQTPHFVPFNNGCPPTPCEPGCGPPPCQIPIPCSDGVVCDTGTVIQNIQVVQPAPAAPAPAPDQAMVDLRAGRYALAAAEFLRRHTAQMREELAAAGAGDAVVPDRSALRMYALALAGAGDLAEAGKMFVQAYREDPLLSGEPIDGRVVRSGMELRRIVVDGVEYAHRSHTFEAWSTVGYLMQAQGRFELASRMFERADAAN